jgi:hypothetical protein
MPVADREALGAVRLDFGVQLSHDRNSLGRPPPYLLQQGGSTIEKIVPLKQYHCQHHEHEQQKNASFRLRLVRWP